MKSIHFNTLLALICCVPFLATNVYGQEQTRLAQRFGSDGLAQVTVNDKSFYINRDGQREFDDFQDPDQHWNLLNWGADNDSATFIVIKDGLKGLRRQDGTWVLQPLYQQIESFADTCWKVTKADKQTFASPTGDLLPYFDEVGYLNGRYFDVKIDGKWGIYDRGNKQLSTPAGYDRFDYYRVYGRKLSYIYAQRNSKSLVVHIPTGKEFMAQGNEWQQILGYGELVVATKGKYGLLDTLTNEILPAVYDAISLPNANSSQGYYGPYAIIEKDGKKGVYASGKGIVMEPKWDDIRVYDDYLALSREGKYGLYNGDGKELLTPSYTDITHINDYFYSSGSGGWPIFKTQQKAHFGLFFAESGVEIPAKFHQVYLSSLNNDSDKDWNYDLIVGEYQGEKSFFDLKGNALTSKAVNAHSDIPTDEQTEQQQGQIASKNNIVLPTTYDAVESFNNGQYLLLQQDGKFGIADSEGRVLLPVEFDNLLLDRLSAKHGITFPILAKKDNEWRYYKEDGSVLSVEGVGNAPWRVKTGL